MNKKEHIEKLKSYLAKHNLKARLIAEKDRSCGGNDSRLIITGTKENRLDVVIWLFKDKYDVIYSSTAEIVKHLNNLMKLVKNIDYDKKKLSSYIVGVK